MTEPREPENQVVALDEFRLVCERIETEDSQFWRRAYCRSLMTLFEAAVNDMAADTLAAFDGMLGDDEKRALTRRSGALTRAFDALDLYTNCAGATTPLQRETEEWLVLEKAIRIRNRITHPAKEGDLTISDQDMAHLRATSDVVYRVVTSGYRDAGRALTRRLQKFRAVVKQRAGRGPVA